MSDEQDIPNVDNEMIQKCYDSVAETLNTLDPEDNSQEALLVGTIQALVDKISASMGEDFHPYAIKDLGDVMHEFCNDYSRAFIDEEESDSSEESTESLDEASQGE